MFNFLFQAEYKDRVVGRWDNEDGTRMVSTAAVNDGAKPYETAFKHERYNNGKMVIVEAYDTKEEAIAGHARWTAVMTEGPLPPSLKDCSNSEISQFCDALGAKNEYPLGAA